MAKCKSCGHSEEAFAAPPRGTATLAAATDEQAFASTPTYTSSKCTSSFKCSKCGSQEAYPAIPAGFNNCGCLKPSCKTCCPVSSNVFPTCYPIPAGISCDPACSDQVSVSKFWEPISRPEAPRPFPANSKEVYARFDSSIVFPDLDKSVQVYISNIKLTDGQVIDHPDYGPLSISKLDDCTNCPSNSYLATNRSSFGTELNSVGNIVPCGTEFAIGFVSCPCGEEADILGCNHLVENFTVPAISSTAVATVENLAGFVAGDKVVIRNIITPTNMFIFTLSDVIGPNTLVLENTGQGGTIGATYLPDADGDDLFDFCVEPLNAQGICAQANETTCIKYLIGCDEDGNLVKIKGEHENEAPVYDPDCAGYTNKVLPKTTKCVLLQSCFQVAPVADICDHQVVTITTSDDQGLLDEATAVLLSPNAEPQITICGYTFSLNLLGSSVGMLLVTPIFNPYEVVEFCDDNCPVCIPEDCCFQCNPQVQYPVEAFFPPGFNDATTLAIPTNLLVTAGEYKFSVVKSQDNTANILLYHNPSSDVVEHAYNGDTGAEIALGTLPGDTNDYFYHKLTYCHQENACPVDGQFEEDILARFYTLPNAMEIVLNYHTLIEVFRCDEVGDEGLQLTETSFSILGNFTGPTHVVTVADGLDPWGTPAPVPNGSKTYDSFSGYNKRTVSIFYPTCMVATTKPTILIRVEDGWIDTREVWVYDTAFTFTVPAGAVERFRVGDRVRWTESATLHSSIISVVTDTIITILDAAVASNPITNVQWSKGVLWEDTTLPPAGDFIYFNMETTSMFRTQLI